jgi:hypothetical protein
MKVIILIQGRESEFAQFAHLRQVTDDWFFLAWDADLAPVDSNPHFYSILTAHGLRGGITYLKEPKELTRLTSFSFLTGTPESTVKTQKDRGIFRSLIGMHFLIFWTNIDPRWLFL